ncbi:MAG: TVP38/TMEM64 family protein [Euryarchaeota archaeon]|nr:TVP38/TMEM64 family protein [Euryarchaeota archaeon]|tara:strand:+ start:1385 stop:2053 length:669 start_codon:yes stop_codon:yes gene_type:complete
MELNYKKIIFTLCLLIGIIFAIINREFFNNENITNYLDGFGILAPLIFIFIYIIATIVFLPGLILTMLAGILFGPVFGTIYSIIGATIGATLAFLIARYLAIEKIEKLIEGKKLDYIRKSVENEGWKFVAYTRLVPLFPFNLLNYSYGLTNIKLKDYIWASFIFMLPGTFAYVYLGFTGTEILNNEENLIRTVLILIAIFATIIYIPYYLKKVSKLANEYEK